MSFVCVCVCVCVCVSADKDTSSVGLSAYQKLSGSTPRLQVKLSSGKKANLQIAPDDSLVCECVWVPDGRHSVP